jgi:predicted MFS family arabinose efflux permease
MISGLGSITGALTVAGLGNLPNKGFFALWSLIGLGGLVIVFALSANLWLSYGALFLASGLLMCAFAFLASLAQNMATDEMRGRVMSLYNVAFRGGGPIGAVLCGELMEATSVQPVLAGCGVLLALLGAWFLLVQRRVSTM